MRIPGIQSRTPHSYRPPVSVGQSGPLWRVFAALALGLGAVMLIAEGVLNPSKRNVELIAAVVFLCFALASHPMRAFYMALALLPFHVSLFVGTTTTLLIFGVGALVLAKAKSMHLDPPLRDNRLNIAIFGWVLTMILSFWQAPAENMRESLILLQAFIASLILIFTMSRLVRTERDLHNMLRTLQFVVLVTAIIALLQSTFPQRQWLPSLFSYQQLVSQMDFELEAGQVRAFATFAGYEFFAEYMAISFLIQFILMRMATSTKERILWGFGSAACFMALFASATRGPLLALGVALVWLIVGGRGAVPRRQVLGLVFAGIILLQVVSVAAPHIVNQMFDRMSEDLTQAGSMDSREVTWRQAIDAIARSPLIGHGLDIPLGTWRGGVAKHVHSLYINLAYTIGIPGLLMFGAVMFRFFQISLRRARDRHQSPLIRHVMMGLNASIVLFAIDQLKIEYLRAPVEITLWWGLLGFVLAAEKLARQQERGMTVETMPNLEWIPNESR